jgi:hypothetical protein
MMCGWIMLLAAGEVNGWWMPPDAVRDLPEMVRWVVFWWALFGATGFLTRLFSTTTKQNLNR